MASTITALLQLAASLLVGAQHNPAMPLAAQQQIIAVAAQTVQLSTQAIAMATGQINFPVPQNMSIWPTAADLQVAPYLDARGGYAQLGAAVQLDSATISFGDLNGDGYDDAMVAVRRMKPDGSGLAANYDLAAMLNQGGIMFNIADTPLGGAFQNGIGTNGHQIKSGAFVLGADRYVLFGDQLIKQ